MWCLWSAKGGVGCTLMASASAVLLSRRCPVLLIDLGGGDVSSMLGIEPGSLGVVDWLAAPNPPIDALARMELTAAGNLDVLCWQGIDGNPDVDWSQVALRDRFGILGPMLAADHRLVIVDLGDLGRAGSPVEAPAREVVMETASRSTLVSRLCYSAVIAAMTRPPPDDVLLVVEPGRSLRPVDVAAALSVDRLATVRWDPAVARAADAGLLTRRIPRFLHRLPIEGLSEGATAADADVVGPGAR